MASSTDAQAEEVKVLQVGDGAFVRQEIDNIGWLDMGEHLLVVDALEHAEKEPDVLQAMRDTVGDKPVGVVFNTHTHYDHVALNDAFRKRFDAQVLSYDSPEIDEDGTWLEGEARRVQVVPMTGCHTGEDCVLWDPAGSVLFVGDIFGWGLIPLTRNLREDSYQLLTSTIRRLIDFGADTVVPGHGPLCDSDTLRRYLEYLDELIAQARRGVEGGKSDQEILTAMTPPEDMRHWWRFVEWKHADSAQKVLKAVRRKWL